MNHEPEHKVKRAAAKRSRIRHSRKCPVCGGEQTKLPGSRRLYCYKHNAIQKQIARAKASQPVVVEAEEAPKKVRWIDAPYYLTAVPNNVRRIIEANIKRELRVA